MRPAPALAPPGPPPGAGAMAFTFAAFCYMLTLVLCASLIFFVIWHVRPGWGWGWGWGRSGGRGRWEQEGDGRMVSGPGETWSLLSAIPHQSATVRPINTPHHRLPSRAPPPFSAAPDCLWVCQSVSDPPPLPHGSLGVWGGILGFLFLSLLFPHPPTPAI